ncbi:MAG: MotA/TolQ/ExbB proton channel family protein [Alphaproteobacteria bacterium]
MLRFAVINLVAFALLGGAYLKGWVHMVISADSTGLTFAIFAAFAVGLAICGAKVWRASAEINWAKDHEPRPGTRVGRYLADIRGRNAESRAILASALRLKLFSRIVVVRQIASTLVVLGLIGTVIGFIIALSGVRPEAAGGPSAIGPMVSTLFVGISVALFTTLVGAVFNVWLMVAYQVLATGTVNMFTAIIEARERDAVS